MFETEKNACFSFSVMFLYRCVVGLYLYLLVLHNCGSKVKTYIYIYIYMCVCVCVCVCVGGWVYVLTLPYKITRSIFTFKSVFSFSLSAGYTKIKKSSLLECPYLDGIPSTFIFFASAK